MRVSNEEKERSRQRIVASAGRLFREKGVEGASVADIMQAAGLTHGGFYRHFVDKESLLAAALTHSFDGFIQPLTDGSVADAGKLVAAFRIRYLSIEHCADPGRGCPAAALGSDISRASEAVQAAFTDGLNQMTEGLAKGRDDSPDARAKTLRDLAMMVGAVVLARGVDDDMGKEILAACAEPFN